MNKGIEKYLDNLRSTLAQLDKSTISDALADAEDHLTAALLLESEENPEIESSVLLDAIIEKYGNPDEILDQYSDIEEITTPVFAEEEINKKKGFVGFIEIITEPDAWASLLYLLLSSALGVIYFTWTVTGFSLSVGLIPLLIGIPVALLVLLSIRGLGFVEGRIIEALLGERMPRRSITPGETENWWEKFKIILTTRSTWTTFVYMLLLLPLGTIYFTLIMTLFGFAISLIGSPITQYVLNEPFVDHGIWIPFYLMPLFVAFGGFLVVLTLHLSKLIGQLHGRFAKAMLVS